MVLGPRVPPRGKDRADRAHFIRGLSEDAENYQVDRKIITRAWLGYAASGTRPTPSSHNATETVTLLKENSFSHPPNSQRGRT